MRLWQEAVPTAENAGEPRENEEEVVKEPEEDMVGNGSAFLGRGYSSSGGGAVAVAAEDWAGDEGKKPRRTTENGSRAEGESPKKASEDLCKQSAKAVLHSPRLFKGICEVIVEDGVMT